MSSSLTENLQSTESHLRLTISSEIVEAPWSQIAVLGDNMVRDLDHRKRPSCLVDLSQLEFMGSSIIALIVRIWKAVKSKNGRLVVVAPNSVVKDTIVLAGLDKIWEICPTIEDGFRALDISRLEVAELRGNGVRSHPAGLSRYERLAWIGVVLALIAILAISVLLLDRYP